MNEAQTEFQRGIAALKSGNLGEALSGFLMALALDPGVPAHREQALGTLGTTAGYTSLPQAVLDGLARCAGDETLELQPLALVVRTLLDHHSMRTNWLEVSTSGDDARIELALADGTFDNFLSDPLISAVLTHAINISLDIEDILTGLRRHGLQRAVTKNGSVLLDRHRTFFAALAQQAERTDFAWTETEQETLWLEKIEDAIDGQLL